jgi:glycine cleavage system transcriptional repressor
MERVVISAIGHDRPGIVNDLAALIRELGLNIEDSRMTVLGGEFAVLMAVAGPPDAIEALRPRLEATCASLGLAHLYRPTRSRAPSGNLLPYAVTVTAMDHPGIVHDVAGFFSSRSINIDELTTQMEHAPHTGTPIFNLEMRVQVPAGTRIHALRAAFEDFCAERDLDGSVSAIS